MSFSKGNKWYYRYYRTSNDTIIFINPNKEYDITFEVIGEKEINRKIYSVIEERYFLTSYIPIDMALYRIEGENLYMFRRDSIPNQYIGGLLAKFSVSEGGTFHCKYYHFDYVATIVKKTLTLTHIYYHIPGGYDEEFEIFFRKNIGIENHYSPDWRYGYLLAKFELK